MFLKKKSFKSYAQSTRPAVAVRNRVASVLSMYPPIVFFCHPFCHSLYECFSLTVNVDILMYPYLLLVWILSMFPLWCVTYN